jgi:hypothetical protein
LFCMSRWNRYLKLQSEAWWIGQWFAGKAPAAVHVKVSRSAMVLLAGSQLLPAESRHGPSCGAGVISPIAASSRNFTPSRAAGCFFEAEAPTRPGCGCGVAMMKALHPDAPEPAQFCQRKKKRPQGARAPGTVSMQMMPGHHRDQSSGGLDCAKTTN